MRRSLTLMSFGMLVLAIVAWVGVGFLFADISERLAARADAFSSSDIQNLKQESAIAQHALVADSVSQRSALDTIVATDVVGIANDINAAGKSADTQTTIGSASAVDSSQAAGVNEVEFVVQSTGTFQQVWRAAQLFQTLPLPSGVSEIDFEQVPDSGLWQLTAHIDVLTSAQISS